MHQLTVNQRNQLTLAVSSATGLNMRDSCEIVGQLQSSPKFRALVGRLRKKLVGKMSLPNMVRVAKSQTSPMELNEIAANAPKLASAVGLWMVIVFLAAFIAIVFNEGKTPDVKRTPRPQILRFLDDVLRGFKKWWNKSGGASPDGSVEGDDARLDAPSPQAPAINGPRSFA